MAKSTVLSLADLRTIVRRVGVDALMDDLIQRVSNAFVDYDPAEYNIPARSGFVYRTPATGLLEWMPARHHDGVASIKVVGYHPENPTAENLPTILSTIASFDTKTGHFLGIVDATFLTSLRTGAASAVATQLLASPRSRTLGLIGAGAQAFSQLHAISRKFDIDRVLVHDVRPEVAASFASRIASLGLTAAVEVTPLEKLVEQSDILCTCTSSEVGTGAVFADENVQPWLHVNAVGSDFPGKIEVPVSLLRRALVVPDFREQALKEGECQQLGPAEIGPDITDIAKSPSRFQGARERISVYDSTGWALEDHIGMQMLLDYAKDLGVGTELDIESAPADPLHPYDLFSREKVVPLESPSDSTDSSNEKLG